MTLTVLCSPQGKGRCEVFYSAAGASGGVLGLFDWGASEDMEAAVDDLLCDCTAEGDA